jgi:hypothetical protein
MAWQQAADYAYCQQLDLPGWAWQFLRRNPAYQADYAEFIELWRQLEAEYGKPPQRDFFKWKQDPRAWRAEAEIAGCGTEVCPGENEQVLIECWMGAKWGFRKFPIDPAIVLPEDLVWREFPIEVGSVESGMFEQAPTMLALNFDLALPLPAQLEAAKQRLIAARNRLAHTLPPRNPREGVAIWQRWLRILDALAVGASTTSIARTLSLDDPEGEIAAATAMQDGYRRLLMLQA